MARRLQVFETSAITVTFDRARCIHSEECVRGLPSVFDPTQRRWIRPDRADPEVVAAAVARCPSGALKVQGAGVPPAAASGEPTLITVTRDGPLLVRGALRVEGPDGEVIETGEAVALCRCGATGHPPFCDGSHTRIDFSKG